MSYEPFSPKDTLQRVRAYSSFEKKSIEVMVLENPFDDKYMFYLCKKGISFDRNQLLRLVSASRFDTDKAGNAGAFGHMHEA